MSASRLRPLLEVLDEHVQWIDEIPDPAIRDRVVAILQLVDRIHRPGVQAAAELLQAGDQWEAAKAREELALLMALYDRLPVEPDAPTRAPPTSTPAQSPLFFPIASLASLGERGVVARARDLEVLLLRSGSEVVAFAATCPACGRSLEGATRSGGVLLCPLNNCAYRLTSGRRADGEPGEALRIHPVRIEGDTVLLALGHPPPHR